MGLLFLVTTFLISLVSVFLLHFTQYIVILNTKTFILKTTMEVKNLSWNNEASKRSNSPLLPRSIRCLIVGKSGCGKTTLLLNLLLRPEWLDYDNLQVFGRSLFQPEYQILKKAFEEKLPKEAIVGLFSIKDEIMKLDVSPAFF